MKKLILIIFLILFLTGCTRYVEVPVVEIVTETITETVASQMTIYPITLGKYSGLEVQLNKGKYGPYLQYDGRNIKVKNTNVNLATAIEYIEENKKTVIKRFGKKGQVRNGPYGPYVLINGKTGKIPNGIDPSKLTFDECKKLIKHGTSKWKKKGKKTRNK